MVPVTDSEAIWLVIAALGTALIGYRVLKSVLHPAALLLWRGLTGGLALWALDLAGGPLGFHIGLNPATALAAGFLGVPGLFALTGLRLLFP